MKMRSLGEFVLIYSPNDLFFGEFGGDGVVTPLEEGPIHPVLPLLPLLRAVNLVNLRDRLCECRILASTSARHALCSSGRVEIRSRGDLAAISPVSVFPTKSLYHVWPSEKMSVGLIRNGTFIGG